MLDQMIWNTDGNLQVTSLTARLRDFAGVGDGSAPLYVGDLWDDRDPFPLLAHQWCLGGESLAFETTVRNRRLQFELAPLLGADGSPCGVTGRAIELAPVGQRGSSLLLVDLDRFGSVNDAYGRSFGDRVLEAVAERLSRNVSPSDSVTRLGADRYAIVLGNAASNDEALCSARVLLRSFDDPLYVDGTAIRLSASIGVATSAAWTSSGAMIGAAAREVDAVKRNGGNGIKCALVCRAPSSPGPRHYAILESA